jgi:hypothetical protein
MVLMLWLDLAVPGYDAFLREIIEVWCWLGLSRSEC